MLCRLIHSAVEPDSVSARMALQPRWCAVNSAPIAIDWSMRPKRLLVKSVSIDTSSAASASSAMAAICVIVSTGYLPAAVSALSITASVPSSTALATSLTSARVGTGLTIIDSIICVAVMTTLSISRAMLDHALLQRRHGGVADFDRQVAARDHDAVAGLEDLVEHGNRLAALDLGDQRRLVAPRLAGHVGELARHLHVGGVLREAHRQVLALEGSSRS